MNDFNEHALLNEEVQQDYLNWILRHIHRAPNLPTMNKWIGYTLNFKECPGLLKLMKAHAERVLLADKEENHG